MHACTPGCMHACTPPTHTHTTPARLVACLQVRLLLEYSRPAQVRWLDALRELVELSLREHDLHTDSSASAALRVRVV